MTDIHKLDSILYNVWYYGWFKLIDYSLSKIILTTYEKEEKQVNFPLNLLICILSMCLAVVLTPIGLLFYLLWLILSRDLLRSIPYKISIRNNAEKSEHMNSLKFKSNNLYEVMSSNVCLLPECISRFNNLHASDSRLNIIGDILTNGSEEIILQKDLNNNDSSQNNSFIQIMDNYVNNAHNIDFICFQEVFTTRNSKRLKEILHKKYPYIVYDVGVTSVKSNCYIGLDSGLMFCSKYPILKADFKPYTAKMKTCKFSSKGLLIVKVFLGKTRDEKDVVGIISNTHLQSYQGETNIHSLQMDEMLEWIDEFKSKYVSLLTEILAFDIICGDFNLDTYSEVDKNDINHHLFKIYNDPITIDGNDHPNSVGTEMRQFSLYDDQISTPEKLKDILLHERKRRWYIFDANIKEASFDMLKERPELDEDGLPVHLPNISGNRRVDRIIYNSKYKLVINNYKFITNFTRLTDHIPISMEFKCMFDDSLDN